VSIDALVTGHLVRDPVTRVGKSGNSFTTALLRATTGEEQQTLVSVIAFQEAGEKLSRLKSGDVAAVVGSAKLSSWEKAGETRHGLSVTVSSILSAYDVKRRRGTDEKPRQQAETEFDDSLNF
jgi:single-stranded DNA-binding protein